MTKIIQGGLFLVSAPFTLRNFLPESVFSKYRGLQASRVQEERQQATASQPPQWTQKHLEHASRLWYGVKLLNLFRLSRGPPLWDLGKSMLGTSQAPARCTCAFASKGGPIRTSDDPLETLAPRL